MPVLSSTIPIPVALMETAAMIVVIEVNLAMPRPAANHRLPIPVATSSTTDVRIIAPLRHEVARNPRGADQLPVEGGDVGLGAAHALQCVRGRPVPHRGCP